MNLRPHATAGSGLPPAGALAALTPACSACGGGRVRELLMAYVPEFMRRSDEFARERDAVRTREEWRALSRKWLDASAWPRKTPEQCAEDQARKRGPVRIGGRTWSSFSDGLDLDPLARYVLHDTVHRVGDPLVFPQMADVPREAGAGWVQECGYCEISTRELGEETCPRCGRKLHFANYSE